MSRKRYYGKSDKKENRGGLNQQLAYYCRAPYRSIKPLGRAKNCLTGTTPFCPGWGRLRLSGPSRGSAPLRPSDPHPGKKTRVNCISSETTHPTRTGDICSAAAEATHGPGSPAASAEHVRSSTSALVFVRRAESDLSECH
jgi:hypothetical protein